MAEAQNASAQPPQAKPGERVIVREYEVQPQTAPAPTKLFRLKAGASHHIGDAVVGLRKLTSGGGPDAPTVRLTEAQARAFADKFEAVDNSDFEVVSAEDETRRREASTGRPQNVDHAKDTEGGPQGKPPVGPPEVVHGAVGKAGAGLPADITTLDPARQGQPTEEQARVIRSGGAPPPTFKVDPKDTPDVPQKVGSPAVPITGGGDALGPNKNSTVESTKVPDSVSGQSGGSAKATETKK